MTLTEVVLHVPVKVVSYGSRRGLANKLRQLGILPGEVLTVIRQAPLHGPLLIQVKDREIAIGREIANRIIVETECE